MKIGQILLKTGTGEEVEGVVAELNTWVQIWHFLQFYVSVRSPYYKVVYVLIWYENPFVQTCPHILSTQTTGVPDWVVFVCDFAIFFLKNISFTFIWKSSAQTCPHILSTQTTGVPDWVLGSFVFVAHGMVIQSVEHCEENHLLKYVK